MLPKLRVEGVIRNCAWVPMPVRAAVSGSVEAEVETLRVPVRVPGCVGSEGDLQGAAGVGREGGSVGRAVAGDGVVASGDGFVEEDRAGCGVGDL